MSIASLLDLSSLAKRGIPPALRIACLFLVLLLQLHRASAPQRATSASRSDALIRVPQSRSDTCQLKRWQFHNRCHFRIPYKLVARLHVSRKQSYFLKGWNVSWNLAKAHSIPKGGVGILPDKSDIGDRWNIWKELLKGTRILFCGHHLNSFSSLRGINCKTK